MGKARKFSSFKRRPTRLKEKRTFLIVSTGKRTEPIYFADFNKNLKNATLNIETFIRDPQKAVEKAIELKRKRRISDVWVVFDIDNYRANLVQTAFDKAKANKIGIAYSNSCFEVWFLLHFNLFQTGILPKDCRKKLNQNLTIKYNKSVSVFDEIFDKKKVAIRNATTLYQQAGNIQYNKNPSTSVFQLVEILRKYL